MIWVLKIYIFKVVSWISSQFSCGICIWNPSIEVYDEFKVEYTHWMIMMLVFFPQEATFFFLFFFESKVRSSVFSFHLSFWFIESLNMRLLKIRPEFLRWKREVILLHCLLALWLPCWKRFRYRLLSFCYRIFSVSSTFQIPVIISSKCLVLLLAYKNILVQIASYRKAHINSQIVLTFVNLFCEQFTLLRNIMNNYQVTIIDIYIWKFQNTRMRIINKEAALGVLLFLDYWPIFQIISRYVWVRDGIWLLIIATQNRINLILLIFMLM